MSSAGAEVVSVLVAELNVMKLWKADGIEMSYPIYPHSTASPFASLTTIAGKVTTCWAVVPNLAYK